MREVGRRREFEDELPARRIPAFELLERVADVAAEDDRAFVSLDDDDLMSGRVSRRRQEPDPRQDLRLAVVLDVRRARKVDPLPAPCSRPRVRELASLDVDRDARKSRLPPQWSKWRCVLTTTATRLTSSSGSGFGCHSSPSSSIAGVVSIIPVSTRTSPSGCSIVSENPGKRSPEKNISLVRCRPISSGLSTALTPFSAASSGRT